MKRFFLFILLILPVLAYSQNYTSPGIPSGTASFSPTFRTKAATPDSLAQIWLAIGGNKFYRMLSGMDVIVFDARVVQGLGTTSSKLTFRDTLLKSNWVINPADTLHPALTVISDKAQAGLLIKPNESTDGRAVVQMRSAKNNQWWEVGANPAGQNKSFGIRRMNGVALPAVDYLWYVEPFTDTSVFPHQVRFTNTRSYTPGDSVAYLKNGFLEIGPASGGGIDTVHTGNGITGTGSISDPVILFGDPTLNLINVNTNTIFNVAAPLHFITNDIDGNNSTLLLHDAETQITTNTANGSVEGIISAAAQTGNATLLKFGVLLVPSFDYQGFAIADSSSMKVVDDRNHIGLTAEASIDTSLMVGDVYVTEKKVRGMLGGGGVGSVTSITPGVGFLSHTPITTSGTMDVDTASTIVTKTFAGRYIKLNSLSATSPIFYNNTTGVISSQAASASQNGYLTSTDWSTFNGKSSFVSPLTTTGDIIYSSSGSTPARLAIGGANTVLHGGTTPSYSAIVNGDITNGTIDLTTKVTGVLPNANTTATNAATASTIMSRDANINTNINNLIQGYATTATVAGTTILTVSSAQQQYFTGTTTQTVTLPVTSTLVLGQQFAITNLSTGSVTVNSSGGNLVQVMTQNTIAVYTCILTSGTTAASWSVSYSSSTPGGTVAQSIQINNIQTTPTDALSLLNTTLSTSGVQSQYSPSLIFGGHKRNTSTPGDVYSQWRVYDKADAGANNNSFLNFDYYGGASSTPTYTNIMTLDGNGNASAANFNGQNTVTAVNRMTTPTINSGLSNTQLKLQGGLNFTAAGTFVQVSNTGVNHSSGTFIGFDINDVFNESSTAADIDFTINRTENTLGSNGHKFASWLVGGVEKFGMLNTGQLTLPLILKGYTVSTLPTGVTGMTAYVTDALTPVALSTVAGGGSSVVPVFYNGTNWIVQ